MATSAIAGFRGEIYASSSAGGVLNAIAEIRDWSVDVQMNEIDATSHDSSGAREVIAGITRWQGQAAGMWLNTNAGHMNAFSLLVAGTKRDFAFYPTGSSSDGYYSGSGYMTNWRLAAPNEDALAFDLSFVGTGVLARTSS